jgi:hypothetical protein
MYSSKSTAWLAAAVFTALIVGLLPAISKAGKPDKPGKPGGGSGGDPYLVVELPQLFPDEGFLTESVSDVSPEGFVYVVGNHGRRACLWTVDTSDPALTVVADDLSASLYRNGLDVNSAGIVAGWQRDDLNGDLTPVLLTPNNEIVHLPEAKEHAQIRINNPGESGIFQVVGDDLLWDVSVDGTVLGPTVLVDAQGRHLYATDINDSQQIAGLIVQNEVFVPALGEFAEDGELSITPLINPDPEFIAGFSDMQIDDAGNVLGDGWEEPADPDLPGVFPRAVVWQANGQVIDLGTELGTTYISSNSIANVNGTMQCVGTYLNRDLIAYVYSAGTLFELQDVDSQFFEIDRAGGINRAGMICARGKVGKRRDYQLLGCLLIPVTP